MFTWQRTENGETSAICTTCGRIYSMSSEWDRANLDWHEHEREGV